MLVSIASLAPIIIVAPVADIVGREPVIMAAGVIVFRWASPSATRAFLRYQDVAGRRRLRAGAGRAGDRRDGADDLGTVPPITEIPVPAPAPIPTSEIQGIKSTRRARDRAIGDGEPPDGKAQSAGLESP